MSDVVTLEKETEEIEKMKAEVKQKKEAGVKITKADLAPFTVFKHTIGFWITNKHRNRRIACVETVVVNHQRTRVIAVLRGEPR